MTTAARLVSFFYLLLLIPFAINIGGASANAEINAMNSAGNDGLTWPDKDLVGMTGDEARAAVLAGVSTLSASKIEILPEDAMVTMDFVQDRVRIFVSDDGKVARQPHLG
eukprot:CAMPEP_0172309672 /NCGR_PEP_ID=MMETSP1058-20130122/10394_1 /TAXON_ID=83371 /ORGANISM="Detonula confervacea, Strain CCMP 353" /LENGTH=109 /DNA_ID=CAMNT_0013022341 /DNA_START=36 /DNA_END=365 /DNA_ORIENTATION=+